MDRMAEFLAMGHYGGYVWPSYILAAVILVGLAIQSRRWLRNEERAVRAMEADAPHRRAAAASGSAGRETRQ